MTTTTRKTGRGNIVTVDGFSDYYGAYVQGNRTYTVWVPDGITATPELLASEAATSHGAGFRTDAERACRVMAVGTVK